MLWLQQLIAAEMGKASISTKWVETNENESLRSHFYPNLLGVERITLSINSINNHHAFSHFCARMQSTINRYICYCRFFNIFASSFISLFNVKRSKVIWAIELNQRIVNNLNKKKVRQYCQRFLMLRGSFIGHNIKRNERTAALDTLSIKEMSVGNHRRWKVSNQNKQATEKYISRHLLHAPSSSCARVRTLVSGSLVQRLL